MSARDDGGRASRHEDEGEQPYPQQISFLDEEIAVLRRRLADSPRQIVPQLLSEIDGVEGLENVIVIGASNRVDKTGPAILRPGRLDVKIKIERPDAEAAKDIFSMYALGC